MLASSHGADWTPYFVGVLTATTAWGFVQLNRFTRWAVKRRREQLDSQLLSKVADKIDKVDKLEKQLRDLHEMASATHAKIDETKEALEIHTNAEASLIRQVVDDAVRPIVGRIDAQSAEFDRKFRSIEQRLTDAHIP